jgi:hypothetical protein
VSSERIRPPVWELLALDGARRWSVLKTWEGEFPFEHNGAADPARLAYLPLSVRAAKSKLAM